MMWDGTTNDSTFDAETNDLFAIMNSAVMELQLEMESLDNKEYQNQNYETETETKKDPAGGNGNTPHRPSTPPPSPSPSPPPLLLESTMPWLLPTKLTITRGYKLPHIYAEGGLKKENR